MQRDRDKEGQREREIDKTFLIAILEKKRYGEKERNREKNNKINW